jgi:hypothetical protein
MKRSSTAAGPRLSLVHAASVAALAVAVVAASGCATQAQTGAAWGTGIGALAGQVIGGDTGATLVGAAVGAGVGYLIGNEQDKQRAATVKSNELSQMTAPLGGTRWTVVDWSPRSEKVAFTSKTVDFRPNGEVVTTTVFSNGATQTDSETYRVLENTLIVNKPGYMVNYKFNIAGDTMTINAERVRATLRRI